jgi:parvulin-like peptidyl-prolyl isomerase
MGTSTTARLVREPLVHFIAAGAVLFVAYGAVRGPTSAASEDTTIVVDRGALLSFMQYRANAFEPEAFGAALDGMPAQDLRRLIDEYIEEEVLYREARSLGLDESDYVIRRRMVQKVEFLFGDIASTAVSPDEDALRDYFASHRDDYAKPATLTFEHVYFDSERRGEGAARADAARAVQELSKAGARTGEAAAQGDPFPFLAQYSGSTLDHVAGHFGKDFALALDALAPSAQRWQGPIRSAYGEHAVRLTSRMERSYPSLDEVRATVERDLLRDRSEVERSRMVASLRGRYRVEVADVRPKGFE